MRNINKIIVHCSATPEDRDVSIDTIRKWHVEDNGWSDIGYHWVIPLSGSIEKVDLSHDPEHMQKDSIKTL